MDTQEWSDGVLAIKIRDCAEADTPDRKWIVFDGPVDAVWIENMNTVLDDNKKLCLTSGQIIKLKPCMTIMFQVDDLSHASPATISRCGMVLLESAQLGHSVFITSYATDLKVFIEDKACEKFEELFHYLMDLCVEFTRVKGKFPCPGTGSFVVNHMIRLIDCYMDEFKPRGDDDEEVEIPKDIEDRLTNALVYAAIWGIGGCLEENPRPKFDVFLQDLINGEDCVTKYELDLGPDCKYEEGQKIPNKLGEYKTLFDVYFDAAEMRWTPWMSTVPKYVVDKDAPYLSLSIPTVDSIRLSNIARTLLTNRKHVLLVGPTGTGKSVSVNNLLRTDFDNLDWVFYKLGFSAQTTA